MHFLKVSPVSLFHFWVSALDYEFRIMSMFYSRSFQLHSKVSDYLSFQNCQYFKVTIWSHQKISTSSNCIQIPSQCSNFPNCLINVFDRTWGFLHIHSVSLHWTHRSFYDRIVPSRAMEPQGHLSPDTLLAVRLFFNAPLSQKILTYCLPQLFT